MRVTCRRASRSFARSSTGWTAISGQWNISATNGVAVATAQADSDRHSDGDVPNRIARRRAKLQISTCFESAVQLSDARFRIELERGQRVRLQRRASEDRTIDGRLERELLDVREHL